MTVTVEEAAFGATDGGVPEDADAGGVALGGAEEGGGVPEGIPVIASDENGSFHNIIRAAGQIH